MTTAAEYLGILIASYESEMSTNLLEEWVKDCRKYPYSVYGGSYYQKYSDIFAYDFSENIKAMVFINPLSREAENTIREEKGIPKIGEGWVAETTLYYEIKKEFPEFDVVHHARPEWLYNQHLDIYITELKLGMEFQGSQHDMPVEFFGGEEAFEKVKKRDLIKARKCKKNGVYLIHVRPGYRIEDIFTKIREKIK